MPTDAVLSSQWLTGTIRHRRMAPVGHQFSYRIGMLALELSEWSTVTRLSPWFSLERFNWLSLKRRDYFRPDEPDLRKAVADQVEAATGWRPDGPVELITHPRYLGYVFNPVSFYFCYPAGTAPAQGAVPRVIAAEITNTPWHERHLYCLEAGNDTAPVTSRRTDEGEPDWTTLRFDFDKRFHVSPFNPMEQNYRWAFSFRGPDLRIHMNISSPQGKDFDATLVVHRTPLTRKTLHESLRRFPLESFKVVAGIYWQALRLWLKGVPFRHHPDTLPEGDPAHRRGSHDRGNTVSPHADSKTKVSSWRT